MNRLRTSGRLLLLATGLAISGDAVGAARKVEGDPKDKVSYYRQIRPVFQTNCQGCHQPAKSKGGYVMTDFARLLGKGDSGEAAVVPRKPEASHLLKMITPKDGEAEMPKGKPALAAVEIELVRQWIAQGAKDDTPANAVPHYDAQHPPTYSSPPVITSLDYSPDGSLIAVAGFHEVLLHRSDGSGLAARLVGLSERVQTVRFSPDGTMLAVAGGQPARLGEIQVWEVASRKLLLSAPVTYDTVYGCSWSPDGKLIAFGCADNTVRAIEARTGKQVLQQGSHSDWVLDTVFSTKGDHVLSTGRDMSVKLTELATQRFVDNVTSITPGALRGGNHALARHPERDEVLIGSSDGVPQIYRVFRQTIRRIGDNAALIRKFPPMTGRIYSVNYSPDGKRIAAGSSLDGVGAVNLYSAVFDSTIPTNLVKVFEKTVGEQKPEEKAEIEKYFTSDVKLLAHTEMPAGIYAVSFSPDGQMVAVAGADGIVRLLNSESGSVCKEFDAVPLSRGSKPKSKLVLAAPTMAPAQPETLPPGDQVLALEVQPDSVKLVGRHSYVQLLVTARLASGDTVDVTRMATYKLSGRKADLAANGRLVPRSNGRERLKVTLGGQTAMVPVDIQGMTERFEGDFIRDVNPVLTKLGCNAGTCHGAKEGKNGFKLSLRGYDPLYDMRSFTDDLASRRVNVASPDDSLILLKATAEVPHEGGRRTHPDEKYYQVLRAWIAGGAKLNLQTPKVTRIEVFPKDPVVQQIGAKQQMRVVATYADHSSRDVTGEAFIESGNTDVAKTAEDGLVTTLRRGEAPVLARYEGAYAATTVTVMGDRAGFVWQSPPGNNRIDELVAAKWQRLKILPSELCTDLEFVRRVYLDLTGLPPSTGDVRKFVADQRDTRAKRDELIDRLIGSSDYVDHWANKWADLLEVNGKFLGREGADLFRKWIRYEVERNTPYNEFVEKILTATGSNKENPAASYFKVLRTPAETMENTTHLFLATRFNCNKCHDHPFERWTQDQYYQTAAFFAQIGLKRDPASGDRNIGGTAVEGAKPLYETVYDFKEGDVKHLRTGQTAEPEFPFPAKYAVPKDASRRERLAAWLTSPDNRYFAMSYANRIWGYLLGVGIIEPLDDIRAGNPPTNPELLEYLTHEFVQSKFDVQHLFRLICRSRTYQLALSSNKWNADDKINYSHALARRLPAEVLFDAVFKVTGATPNIPGVPAGTRASQLSDSAIDVPSGFLATLGRPVRESACECERSNELGLGSVMSLLSGPTVASAIGDQRNGIAKLVASERDDRKMIDELFMRILNRPASEKELQASLQTLASIDKEHAQLAVELAAYEKKMAPIMAEKERQRLAAIDRAKVELTAYEKQIAPREAELDQQQKANVAKLEGELKSYEETLPARLAAWEQKRDRRTVWVTLDPKTMRASNGAKLAKEKDLSIYVSGGNNRVAYTVAAETALTDITGVKLEALTDPRLPRNGPGRAPDGNFVLSEFGLAWAAKAEPKKSRPVGLQNARADVSQKGFDVKLAIDGQSARNNKGWAVLPQTGENHEAVFETKGKIGSAAGSLLTFTLDQQFNSNQHSLGRFRLSVTTSPAPLDFGVPEDVARILAVASGQRTDEQGRRLLAFFGSIDPELQKRQRALAAARQPRPIDPRLKELRETLARVTLPVPLDPKLVQLREDAAMSAKQLTDKRLTGAQDVAWALINNPAFLFNH